MKKHINDNANKEEGFPKVYIINVLRTIVVYALAILAFYFAFKGYKMDVLICAVLCFLFVGITSFIRDRYCDI